MKETIFALCSILVLGYLFYRLVLALRGGHKKQRPTKRQHCGYNHYGINAKGQYNRLYDRAVFRTKVYSAEGFLNPAQYPVGVTDHARERMQERMGIVSHRKMDLLALDAYQFGKSALQVPKSAAARMREIEQRDADAPKVVLLYRGYVYIFSRDNSLITVYENTNIRL